MDGMSRAVKIGVGVFAALWIVVFVLLIVGVIPIPMDTGTCAVEYTAEGC
jgi:hypothetical protein